MQVVLVNCFIAFFSMRSSSNSKGCDCTALYYITSNSTASLQKEGEGKLICKSEGKNKCKWEKESRAEPQQALTVGMECPTNPPTPTHTSTNTTHPPRRPPATRKTARPVLSYSDSCVLCHITWYWCQDIRDSYMVEESPKNWARPSHHPPFRAMPERNVFFS